MYSGLRGILITASLLAPIAPAFAQLAPVQAGRAASVQAPAAAPFVSVNQPVSVVAGTGVLLHLPQPAATVLAADPDIARAQPASPTSLFLMGSKPGHTTVVATGQNGVAIAQYDVTVTPAASMAPGGPSATAVQSTIGQSVQGAQGVRVRAAGNGSLVLNGTVGTAMAAQQAEAIARTYAGDKGTVTNDMTVLGSVQVNVRVRIAEINRSITRQLGFNWQALGSGNGWSFGLRTAAAATGVVNPLIPLGLTALTNAPVPNQVGAGFISGNKAWDVNAVVDALAADQLITILAEPNLTAQSGETASFLAGGEFPIPVAGNGNGGSTTITVEFKQYGVSLAIVPTVLSPTRMNLRIKPEVSQLTTQGAVSVPIGNGGTLTIPALTVRRAETTVELGSGQSFAIAGLLERTSNNGTNALPGIGELPVIGALFKDNAFQRGESELVIIVTPYIVQPTASPQALHAPTDGFHPATDLDRILFGRQLAPGSQSPIKPGFILE